MKRIAQTFWLMAMFLWLAVPSFGQDVTSLAGIMGLILKPPATILTVTASQGDGTVCTVQKIAGASINMVLSCSSANGSYKLPILNSTGTAQSQASLIFGDVNCLFLLNPTSTAIPVTGSWTAIAANGVGWQCTTNIRTSGVVSGQTAVVSGAAQWP